ncbi:MAG: nucleotidyltransferase family protein [Acidobacteriota bacterium]
MAASKSTHQIGNVIATALAGSWRRSPQAPECCASSLAEIIPQLVGSMSGAIAWWNIRHTELGSSPAGLTLQKAYRLHSIGSKLREHSIKQVLSVLHSAGVEPLLVKGWAVARLYPEAGLRPYGDIDLVVRREQHALARETLRSVKVFHWVDLHEGAGSLDKRPIEDLYARSRIVELDDVAVRVLAPEDHLRLLCVHMLRHSVHRPLWLCDIAASLESRAENFDWDICLGKDKARANWVTCAIGLAHRLLGAEVGGTPLASNAMKLPQWLISDVLKQWETPYSMSQAPVTHHAPMAKYIRHPRGVLADLKRRWPNPIEATVYTGGRLNELPRLPFQIGECVGRTAMFIARLPRALREGR